LNVSDDELEKRKAKWKPIHPQADRGYVQLYQKTVMQADEGADLDFLRGGSGAPIPRDSH